MSILTKVDHDLEAWLDVVERDLDIREGRDETEFNIALHAVALWADTRKRDVDLLDTPFIVSLEEYEEPDFTGAGVPASLTFD